MAKQGLYSKDEAAKRSARHVLAKVMLDVLKLIHPFMPFVTEELWQKMPGAQGSVMKASFPEPDDIPYDEQALKEMEGVTGLITAIRNIRGEMNIPPGKPVSVVIEVPDESEARVIRENVMHVQSLAKVEDVEIMSETEKPEASATAVFGRNQVHVLLKGLLDFEEEKNRLRKAIQKIEKDMNASNKKLSNPAFLKKAPAEIVEEVREKVKDMEHRLARLNENLTFFESIRESG
jgi:valyl-tRNA synthetase